MSKRKTELTDIELLYVADPVGYVYDTGGSMEKALHSCTANGWLALAEGGRYRITRAGDAELKRNPKK